MAIRSQRALEPRGVSMNMETSWAAEGLATISGLHSLARFQQKQLQEKEQKLLQLYDQQQQRAHQVAQRGSAGSNNSNQGSNMNHQTVTKTATATRTTATSQGGKVRQMFDERRQTTVKGIDRSYPLEPLDNKTKKQTTNGVTPTKNRNFTKHTVTSVKRTARADVNSNVNGGKPVVSYHEEFNRESFGDNIDDDEFINENDVGRYLNGNGQNRHELVDDEDRNQTTGKIHMLDFDKNFHHRMVNDLESEQFPEDLMVEVPDKVGKKPLTKKLSQAELRLERFKNSSKKYISSKTISKKHSDPHITTEMSTRVVSSTKIRKRDKKLTQSKVQKNLNSNEKNPETEICHQILELNEDWNPKPEGFCQIFREAFFSNQNENFSQLKSTFLIQEVMQEKNRKQNFFEDNDEGLKIEELENDVFIDILPENLSETPEIEKESSKIENFLSQDEEYSETKNLPKKVEIQIKLKSKVQEKFNESKNLTEKNLEPQKRKISNETQKTEENVKFEETENSPKTKIIFESEKQIENQETEENVKFEETQNSPERKKIFEPEKRGENQETEENLKFKETQNFPESQKKVEPRKRKVNKYLNLEENPEFHDNSKFEKPQKFEPQKGKISKFEETQKIVSQKRKTSSKECPKFEESPKMSESQKRKISTKKNGNFKSSDFEENSNFEKSSKFESSKRKISLNQKPKLSESPNEFNIQNRKISTSENGKFEENPKFRKTSKFGENSKLQETQKFEYQKRKTSSNQKPKFEESLKKIETPRRKISSKMEKTEKEFEKNEDNIFFDDNYCFRSRGRRKIKDSIREKLALDLRDVIRNKFTLPVKKSVKKKSQDETRNLQIIEDNLSRGSSPEKMFERPVECQEIFIADQTIDSQRENTPSPQIEITSPVPEIKIKNRRQSVENSETISSAAKRKPSLENRKFSTEKNVHSPKNVKIENSKNFQNRAEIVIVSKNLIPTENFNGTENKNEAETENENNAKNLNLKNPGQISNSGVNSNPNEISNQNFNSIHDKESKIHLEIDKNFLDLKKPLKSTELVKKIASKNEAIKINHLEDEIDEFSGQNPGHKIVKKSEAILHVSNKIEREIEKDFEIETKMIQVEQKRKEVEDKMREIEAKEREFEAKLKEVEEKRLEFEIRKTEVESKKKEIESKMRDIETQFFQIQRQNSKIEPENLEPGKKNYSRVKRKNWDNVEKSTNFKKSLNVPKPKKEEKSINVQKSVKIRKMENIEKSKNRPKSESKDKVKKIEKVKNSGNLPESITEKKSKILTIQKPKTSNSNCDRENKMEKSSIDEGNKGQNLERTDSVESALRRFDSIETDRELNASKESVTNRNSNFPETENLSKIITENSKSKEEKSSKNRQIRKMSSNEKKSFPTKKTSVSILKSVPILKSFPVSKSGTQVLKSAIQNSKTTVTKNSKNGTPQKLIVTPQNQRKSRRRDSEDGKNFDYSRISAARDSIELARNFIRTRSPSCKRKLFQDSDLETRKIWKLSNERQLSKKNQENDGEKNENSREGSEGKTEKFPESVEKNEEEIKKFHNSVKTNKEEIKEFHNSVKTNGKEIEKFHESVEKNEKEIEIFHESVKKIEKEIENLKFSEKENEKIFIKLQNSEKENETNFRESQISEEEDETNFQKSQILDEENETNFQKSLISEEEKFFQKLQNSENENEKKMVKLQNSAESKEEMDFIENQNNQFVEGFFSLDDHGETKNCQFSMMKCEMKSQSSMNQTKEKNRVFVSGTFVKTSGKNENVLVSRNTRSPSPDFDERKQVENSKTSTRRNFPGSPSKSPDNGFRRGSVDLKTTRRPVIHSPKKEKSLEKDVKSRDEIDSPNLENLHINAESKHEFGSTNVKKVSENFVVDFNESQTRKVSKKPILKNEKPVTTQKESSPNPVPRPSSSLSASSGGSSKEKMNSKYKSSTSRGSTPRNSGSTSSRPDYVDNLVSCKNCSRRFTSDRIELHEKICAKTVQKKRRQFDAMKFRLQGTDLEPFAKMGSKKPDSKQKKATVKSNWRKTHEEFINTIRSAKQVQAHLAAGGKLSDLPPPPPSDTSDYVQCPHCGRKFNEAAAERHIPKCENMRHNKPNPRAPPKPRR